MSKTLIVSDNEFINLLYVMNLEVYLATDTVLVESQSAAIQLLSSKVKFDLIVTLETINKEPVAKNLQAHLKSGDKNIPIIVTGAAENTSNENMFSVIGKFNIQNILKLGAKILGVTARQMAELNVGAYYPISLPALLGLKKAPCPIYQEVDSTYKILIRQDSELGETLNSLEGVGHVFVNSTDRLTIINKISLTLIEKITASLKNLEDAPVEKKLQVLSDGHEFAAANLFSSDEIRQQVQEVGITAAKVMSAVAKVTPSFKSLVAMLVNNNDGYVFTHSMIMSYVVHHIIKNASWGGENQAEKINFVIFFHDIFLVPIYLNHPELKAEALLLTNEKLSVHEKDIALNHAKMGAEMIVEFKRCPIGADTIIKQHHGMKKGIGFALQYPEDISPISKIMLVSEKFVETLLNASEESRPVVAKLAIIKLQDEFKSASYAKIVNALASVPI